jgi:hypothetical protein
MIVTPQLERAFRIQDQLAADEAQLRDDAIAARTEARQWQRFSEAVQDFNAWLLDVTAKARAGRYAEAGEPFYEAVARERLALILKDWPAELDRRAAAAAKVAA